MQSPFFPAAVAWQTCRESIPLSQLWPEERAQIIHAALQRQLEYSSVRWCARQALQKLGQPSTAIINGQQRDPRWPAGIVGSMSHCKGFHVAAVARQTDCLALGIDAELHQALPADLLITIATPTERKMLQVLTSAHPAIYWATLLFSIKESIFKAWFPLTRRWLDFTQANITVYCETQRFEVALARGYDWPENGGLCGCWKIENEIILTKLTVRPAAVTTGRR